MNDERECRERLQGFFSFSAAKKTRSYLILLYVYRAAFLRRVSPSTKKKTMQVKATKSDETKPLIIPIP
jgi:hypothetical protein